MVQTTIRTEGGVRNPKNLFVTSIRIILCFMSHLGFVDDLSSDRNGHRHDLYNLDDRRINDNVFLCQVDWRHVLRTLSAIPRVQRGGVSGLCAFDGVVHGTLHDLGHIHEPKAAQHVRHAARDNDCASSTLTPTAVTTDDIDGTAKGHATKLPHKAMAMLEQSPVHAVNTVRRIFFLH